MALRDIVPWHKVRRRDEPEELLGPRDVPDVFRGFFEDFLQSWPAAPWRTAITGRFAPALDVSETDKEYRVSVELPGMTKDDIEITVGGGRLTVGGEKREHKKVQKEGSVRVERAYGSFSRTIALPASVDEEEVDAGFKNGVLTIRLRKTAQAQATRVQIKDD